MRIALMQKKVRWAGQPQHVLYLALGLRKRGHDVIVISQSGSAFTERAIDAGLEIRKVPMTSDRRFRSLGVRIRAAREVARIVRDERIDILHCHDPREHQIALGAALLTGVPIVRTKHNLTLHRNAGSRWLSSARTARMIAVSEGVRKSLIAEGLPPEHVTTVHNYVDSETFRPGPPSPELRRELGYPAGCPIVGTVGRLHRAKGIATLVDAMPQILEGAPDVRFLMVGSSYLWWPPRVRELGIEDRVVFTDSVPNPVDYLRLMDVAVFPSPREGLPLVLLESLGTCTPTVAVARSGVLEIVRHEENGLLVEPMRPDQIASAVLRLLGDRDLGRRLATEGRKTATQDFTEKRFLDETEGVYARVLSESASGRR